MANKMRVYFSTKKDDFFIRFVLRVGIQPRLQFSFLLIKIRNFHTNFDNLFIKRKYIDLKMEG